MKKLSVPMTRGELIVGWIYLPLQTVIISLVVYAINLLFGSSLSNAEITFLSFCLDFLCVTVIFHKFLLKNLKATFSDLGKTLLPAGCGYALYWVLSYAVILLIMTVYPSFFNVNDESINSLLAENRGLMIIGTVLLAPITEELLYRGLIFRSIYNRNRLLAYIVSALVFATPHVITYVGQYSFFHLFLCFLQYLPAGFCLGWAYARADSIMAPILMHIFINAVSIFSI